MAPKRPDTSKYLERSALTASSFELDLDRSGVFLDVLKHHYKRTNNPLYAWLALQMAHEFDMALPEWVLSYLRKSADQLLEISGRKGEKTQAAIAEALSLKTFGGGSAFTRFHNELRNIQICLRVQDLREQEAPPQRSKNLCECRARIRYR